MSSCCAKNASQSSQVEWVIDWLTKNIEASAVTQDFHEAFRFHFGGARKETYWGAQPVAKAMRLLAKMEKEGQLVRRRISLGGNWQPGFPKWAISYSLKDCTEKGTQ